MEKQEHKSKWDDLARELGAEISPETEQREQAISAVTAEDPPPPATHRSTKSATVSPPPPKPSAGDWDKLAGDLGLPPVEPAARPAETQPVEQRRPAPPEDASREPAVEQRPAREPRPQPQRREPRQKRQERQPREEREPRQKRPSRGGHRQSSREPRESRQPREPRTPPAEVSSELERESVREADAPPGAPRDEAAKPSAVSLWHKIFGMPAEQSTQLSELPTGADEPDESFDVRDEFQSVTDDDEIRSLSGDEITAAGFVDELVREDESDLASEEAAPADRKHGRGRRRRRGGRGRKTGERPAESRRAAPADDDPSPDVFGLGDDFDEIGEVETVLDDDDSPDDQFDDDENSDGDQVGARESGRTKAAQRTIPSWDEAIGFIVDSNMQSRSQRRPPSRSPSRGNGARGRSRGRRKS